MNHKTSYQVKDNKHKRLHTMYFQLYDILEKAKLLLQKAYKRFLGPRVGLGIDKKKKKEVLWYFMG